MEKIAGRVVSCDDGEEEEEGVLAMGFSVTILELGKSRLCLCGLGRLFSFLISSVCDIVLPSSRT